MNKLDMGQAWSEATSLISANRDVILVIAGVFVFLPNAIVALFMPQNAEMAALNAAENATPEELFAQLAAFYADVWWVFLLLALVQAVGVLGLLALLTDRSRPTVGQALGFGFKALLPYIAAQILLALVVGLVFGLLAIAGAAMGMTVAVIFILLGVIVSIYIWVKLSLLSPVVAIEKELNPLRALARSWRLTKGNSLRLFAFYLLLFVVLMVLTILAGLVFAVFAMAGEQVGQIASALGGSLLNMVTVIVMLAVLAAVHRQLAGSGTKADVFE